VCAVLPRQTFVIDHAQVSFADRRGCLRSVICALPLHVIVRQLPEFFVNERHQPGWRIIISQLPAF
jgi:hypothetical protein